MNKWIRLSAALTVICAACAGVVMMSGCEDDPDTDAATEYFDEGYVSDERAQTVPPRLELTPKSEAITVSTYGGSWPFYVSGGARPYTWRVLIADRGTVSSTGFDSALYTQLSHGDNAVICRDSHGEEVYGLIDQVNGSSATLSPSSVTLTNNGARASFSVSGGVLPFRWELASGTGTIISEAGSQAVYERIGAGDNVIIARDANGFAELATIIQP
jgi:hypothetical protein